MACATLLLAGAAALVLGCGGGGGAREVNTTPAQAIDRAAVAEPVVIAPGADIVIGVSAALSGERAVQGVDLADAVELAVADRGGVVKGHKVRVVRMDDACANAEKAVTVARSFVTTDGLIGVVGPMCTAGAQAADRIYEAAGIPHILPAATRSDLAVAGERFFFRTAWRDDAQAATQARYLYDQAGVREVALVDDGEAYGKTLADAFASTFTSLGGTVASRDRMKRGTTDFSSFVDQIKAAPPSAVVFEGLNPEGVLLMKALAEAGFGGAFMAPDGVLSARDFLGVGGRSVEGAYVTGGANPDPAFVERFRQRTNREPSTSFVLQAYDAAGALMAAVDAAAVDDGGGSRVDRAGLVDALRAGRYAGLTGLVAFDDRGERSDGTTGGGGVVVYRVRDGQFQPAP
ncbi:MAG: branched-chain amino acid ABC transporter substrate-binding protein [Chloroflexi bacterium]|nr:branched-chain amino acid ABC transporter substrate-binding protein [Chloroflexota bacterium]